MLIDYLNPFSKHNRTSFCTGTHRGGRGVRVRVREGGDRDPGRDDRRGLHEEVRGRVDQQVRVGLLIVGRVGPRENPTNPFPYSGAASGITRSWTS